jgi:hypothetical protein
MAESGRRIRSTRSVEPLPLSGVSAGRSGVTGVVNIRGFKDSIAHLPPSHPLKVLIAGEPDELSPAEFEAKAIGWWRLLKIPSG